MSYRAISSWTATLTFVTLTLVPAVRAAEPRQSASERAAVRPSGLREYRSTNLIVYTDLAEPEAKSAIKSLERTLTYAAKYWGRDLQGQIECYLLQNIDQVADVDLPHRLSRVLVGRVGGATLPSQKRSSKQSKNLQIVLASTMPGIADHEIIHAYCAQTFGFTGPCWYREGMAEMAVLRCTRDSGVVCTDEQLQQLRATQDVRLADLLAGDQSSDRIFDSMNAMLAHPKNVDRHIPLSDWQPQDADNVVAARKYYLRSWALCYLLLHNPNYASRFRLLSQKYGAGNEDSFQTFFASVQNEVAFEYAFFLRNIGNGYRVDLCSWDWNKKFRELQRGESLSTRIEAKKGYQASGLTLTAGNNYRYDAVGAWSTSPLIQLTEAGGTADGRGQLVGIIMNNFELSEPFSFGSHGTFNAPTSGNLYLFCRDAWNELHDNQGQIVVRMSRTP